MIFKQFVPIEVTFPIYSWHFLCKQMGYLYKFLSMNYDRKVSFFLNIKNLLTLQLIPSKDLF